MVRDPAPCPAWDAGPYPTAGPCAESLTLGGGSPKLRRVTKTKHVALVLLLAAHALLGCDAMEEERPSLLESEVKLYSQFDEELIIRDFFEDRRGGFFVDVGAWLPHKSSTTY